MIFRQLACVVDCVQSFMLAQKCRIGISEFDSVTTHWGKLLDSDWLRDCEFMRNLRANSVIRGKLQISRAKICNSF